MKASARVTTGLRCGPEMDSSARMMAISAAPVASEFASRARAMLPAARRSAMMPEPTTAARRIAEPRNSETDRRSKDGFIRDRSGRSLAWLPCGREWTSGRERKSRMRRSSRQYASRNARAIWSGVPVADAGSGTPQWAVMGWPGQMGQTSLAALSQTVKMKSICGAPGSANSSQDLLRRPSVGMPALAVVRALRDGLCLRDGCRR